MILPFFRSSVGRIAVRLPNLSPAISLPAFFHFLEHPQERLFPVRRFAREACVVFPQSHLHSHTTLVPSRCSVGRIAVRLPNFCPAISLPAFFHFLEQPQELIRFPVRLAAATYTIFPQSQIHSQTTFPFFRSSVGRMATSFPKRCPVSSAFCKQPQDLVIPVTRLLLRTKTVLPQSQTHSQTVCVLRRSSVTRTAVSFPKRCPVRSRISRQPQERLCPLSRLAEDAYVVFPQSH